MPNKITTETFVERARKIHGDRFDYSKVEYIKARVAVTIICPSHGEFEQLPTNHLRTAGCPSCSNDNRRTHPLKSPKYDLKETYSGSDADESELFEKITDIHDEYIFIYCYMNPSMGLMSDNGYMYKIYKDDIDYITKTHQLVPSLYNSWKNELNWDLVFKHQIITWEFLSENMELLTDERIEYLISNKYTPVEVFDNLNLPLTPKQCRRIFDVNIDFKTVQCKELPLSPATVRILDNIEMRNIYRINFEVSTSVMLGTDYKWELPIAHSIRFNQGKITIDNILFEKKYDEIISELEKICDRREFDSYIHEVAIRSASEDWIVNNMNSARSGYLKYHRASDEFIEQMIFDAEDGESRKSIMNLISQTQVPSVEFIIKYRSELNINQIITNHIRKYSTLSSRLFELCPDFIDEINDKYSLNVMLIHYTNNPLLFKLIKYRLIEIHSGDLLDRTVKYIESLDPLSVMANKIKDIRSGTRC